jgi:hypothetical protein
MYDKRFGFLYKVLLLGLGLLAFLSLDLLLKYQV